MIGRRAVLGISLLSTLLFCAFAAQSASAAKATNTTMVTCVKEPNGKGHFEDAHCDKKHPTHEGEWTHSIPVELGVSTEVAATNCGVTNSTKDCEPALLKSKIGLTAVEITCNTTETEPKTSLVHNAQTGTEHKITGTVRTLFKTCTVNKPLKCTAKEPIEANSTVEAVEKLGVAENEMGIEFKGSGAEETFAEITFEGSECSLKNKTFKAKGSVVGTSGPTTESSQTKHWSGTTVAYTPNNEMQKLKLGVNAAEFSLIATPTNANSKTPLAATTWTATNEC